MTTNSKQLQIDTATQDKSNLSEREKMAFVLKAAQDKLINFCEVINPKWETVFFHELIAKKLQEAVEKVRNKKKARIILTVPPRHGKSQLSSIYFPAWALGKYPDMKFIFATYGAELAEKMGLQTRDVISSEMYQLIFPHIELRQDQKAKAKWMTNKKGSYTAVGAGGAVTGTGGDCFSGDTEILTESGHMRIDTLISLQSHPKVLSYNHDTDKLEWKNILAVSERKLQNVIQVKTSKKSSFFFTPEHRIFTKNRGYIEARLLEKNDVLLSIKQKMSDLFSNEKCSQQRNIMQKVLDVTKKGYCYLRMLFVQSGIRAKQIRSGKTDSYWKQRLLLWFKVFQRTPLFQESQKVFNLQHAKQKKDDEVLQQGMQTKSKTTSRQEMSGLWGSICSAFTQKGFLFNDMLKKKPLPKDDRKRKFTIFSWDKLYKGISRYETIYNPKRWWVLCCLYWQKKVISTPCRSQSAKQFKNKLINIMRWLSHDTSQVKTDSIHMVSDVCGQKRVYDIQVEGNNNFFANGVLVHNCIIIDDLLKSRDEAESETMRNFSWDYYRSTLYSRLEGYGGVIVIMQRWHTEDLVGKLLEEEERRAAAGEPIEEWEIINFPAIAEQDEYVEGELVRKEGEALWPSKFPLEILDNIKATAGVYNFVSQYQQQPVNSETQEFKTEWFKYFDDDALVGKHLKYYTIIDPAISQKKEADNTVVLTVAKEVNGPNWYRVREDAGHFTPTQTINLIFQHQQQYRSWVYVETVAYQAALKFAIMEEQRARQVYFVLNEIKTATNKEVRIRGMIPAYQAGVVWHKRSDTEHERELLTFPRGRRDDRCPIGNTIIDTSRGSIPIKDIKKGDYVLTRSGYRKVLKAGKTGHEKVITRIGITATPNHPVYTERGWVSLEDIQDCDTLIVCKKQLFGMGLSLEDIQNLKGEYLEERFLKVTAQNLDSALKNVPTQGRCLDKDSVEDVYNLHVEKSNEYFANGVLIHNCDAMSMALQVMQNTSSGNKQFRHRFSGYFNRT